MDLNDITTLILTLNESPNLGDTLERLQWARRVVIIDSYSTDETLPIAARFENVEVIQRKFDDHATQWNFGLAQIETKWVLALDADYRCPESLTAELRGLDYDCDAYISEFVYCVFGKPLRATLYPPRATLFRLGHCHYVQDGHTQLLVHNQQRTRQLRTKLLHDDRKSLSHWLTSQARYADMEAKKLAETPAKQLGWKDRIRQWYVLAPLLTFCYCLFARRLFLDGRAALFYTLQRVYAELLLSLKLLDQRLRPEASLGADSFATDSSSNDEHRITVEPYELSHPGN